MDALRSLIHAMAWCSARAASDYRSSATRPDRLIVQSDGRGVLVADPQAARVSVAQTVTRRSAALGARPRSGTAELTGRLLAFRFRETLSDGAAEEATEGWLDENNLPPWDAWVGLLDADTLLSWVAPVLVEKVDRAIAVNAESCLSWLGAM